MPCILAPSQSKARIRVLAELGESQKSESISKDDLQAPKNINLLLE